VNRSNKSIFNRTIDLLFEHIRAFLLLTGAGGILAFAASYLFTPVFRADVTLIPSDEILGIDQNSLLSGFSGIASLVNGGGAGHKENEAVAILKSRALTTAYIKANDLLPVIFDDRWDASANKWKLDRRGKFPTLEDGYKVFDKKIRTVVENRKTDLITVSIDWKDPTLAKQWTDGIVEAANDLLRRQAIERSTRNLEYLQNASDKTTIVGIRDALYKLMEAEIKKKMIASENVDYAFRVVDPAVVPEQKTFPNRVFFLAFGIVFGGMTWFLFAVLRDNSTPAESMKE
jgi:uncharacterized protein involved in exopolysaccharide biosynthesis